MIHFRNAAALLALTFVFASDATAQSGASIFSGVAFGDLPAATTPSGIGRAGAETTFLSEKSVSFSNPASWSGLRFVAVQTGLHFEQFRRSEASSSVLGNSVRLDHFAIGLPVSDTLGISLIAGIHPVSRVDFSYGRTVDVPAGDSTLPGTSVFSGSGGISEGLLGLSWSPLDEVSLGASAGALFGTRSDVSRISVSESGFSDVGFVTTDSYSGFLFRGGLQVVPTDGLTFGVSGTLPATLDVESTTIGLYATNIGDDTASSSTTNTAHEIPIELRAGAQYQMGSATVFAELLTQAWTSSTLSDVRDRMRATIGYERVADDAPSASGLDVWNLRAGLAYEQTYVSINGFGIDEIGVSFGAGIPFARTGILGSGAGIDLGFEIIRRSGGDVEELALRIGVGLTVNELWFR